VTEKETSGVGEWLKGMCQREGLSLREAAARSGLSHTTIEGIMKGTSPTPETIQRLARAFSGNAHEAMALEDSLLILAGYRTKRPYGYDMSQSLGRLIDKISRFDEDKLKLVADFADYLTRMEKDR
jgi:transcriptional regulator with XRE-family HTH domain